MQVAQVDVDIGILLAIIVLFSMLITWARPVEVVPEEVIEQYGDGMALLYQGKNEEAIEVYTEIIDDWPDYAPAYYERSIAYGREDDFDRAIQDNEKVLELDDKDRRLSAMWNIGFVHYYRGDHDQAIYWGDLFPVRRSR